ncbi:MAG TPA: PDZ domain-containing protein, partial [Thermoguttaceae bacterium]|nr:PDZ domain-containing protein [Thermoguttaceae bacterium]
MEKRFILFLVLSFGILVGYQYLMLLLFPPAPKKQVVKNPPEVAKEAKPEQAPEQKPKPKEKEKETPSPVGQKTTPKEDKESPQEKVVPEEKPAKAEPKPEEKEVFPPEQGVTLGSADPASPYRMLVTLTNRGAAIVSVELNSPRYQDLSDPEGMFYDRSGYLGRVWLRDGQDGEGCRVDVVGPGTPAEGAGLRVGDIIQAVDDTPIQGSKGLREALAKTRPNQTIRLRVLRSGQTLDLEARLAARPSVSSGGCSTSSRTSGTTPARRARAKAFWSASPSGYSTSPRSWTTSSLGCSGMVVGCIALPAADFDVSQRA